MDCGEDIKNIVNVAAEEDVRSAINSTILDYYKKFGRKRDLEQYFSLSTAQSEIRDPTSLFWRRMKSQSDDESGGKRSESSTEICRISIKCSIPEAEASSSQDENAKSKSDSGSPPIITDVAEEASKHSDNESVKSDDNSQKSMDAVLDTSVNKPLSPTSSITSQRKLEWDSLADVGYENVTDRKTSVSSLSTLERLALKQQYSNNDTQNDPALGLPTAHSTPQDDNDNKAKGKKGLGKSTKFYRKDIDCVELNVPSKEMNPSQSISVNLTKHISFNVERDGGVSVENIQKDISLKPEKISVETAVTPQVKMDKEIQTSLAKSKEKSSSSPDLPKPIQLYGQGVPVLINLNTLKKRNRRKKLRIVRKKLRSRVKLDANKENLPAQERSGEPVSEAESFEYMPGHIYNQNQMNNNQPKPNFAAGNKSSLESSGAITTDSSKESKPSFTKDLEKSIDFLRTTLQKKYDDSNLKQKLVKEVVRRLLQSSYKGDESTTDFLSGLSLSNKNLGLSESNPTTTSTSDGNNTADKVKLIRPKKSILRVNKFNSNAIASTSQSAPNLPVASNSEKPVISRLIKPVAFSNTESDGSSKDKNSSDTAFAKTSSEELYQKYIQALKREQSYKKHLKDKELFLKQKLVASETGIKMPSQIDLRSKSRLKELMKDLTRNNYDDGSGDASKLEGGSNSYVDLQRYNTVKNQRSHSVFTLSSGGSDSQTRKLDSGKNDPLKAACSRNNHYCCCPYHFSNSKMGVTDSCVQVNIQPQNDRPKQTYCQAATNITQLVSDSKTGEIKYVCLCNQKLEDLRETDNILIYKCSRLDNKCIQSQDIPRDAINVQNKNPCMRFSNDQPSTSREGNRYTDFVENEIQETDSPSKSSQTNLAAHIICNKTVSSPTISHDKKDNEIFKDSVFVHESIRCIQTEISINPKISDPSLSDINIINDNDCVTFIGEQYREISKTSIPSEYPNEVKKLEKVLQSNIKNNSNSQDQKINKFLRSKTMDDNLTIPIQGTNMTLLVSIGCNTGTNLNDNNDQLNRAILTEPISATEKATSLREECSKGVQSQEATIFSELSSDQKKSCFVDTLYAREYSTFPSSKQVNTPNFPANIATGSLGNPYAVQTNLHYPTDADYVEQGSSSHRGKQNITKFGDVVNDEHIKNQVLRNNQTTDDKHGSKQSNCCCPETSKCAGICGDDADYIKSMWYKSKRSDTHQSQTKLSGDDGGSEPTKTDNYASKQAEAECIRNMCVHAKTQQTNIHRDGDVERTEALCVHKKYNPFLEKSERKSISQNDEDYEKNNSTIFPKTKQTDSRNIVEKSDADAKCGKQHLLKDKQTTTNDCESKTTRCLCSETSKCRGVCEQDADCMKPSDVNLNLSNTPEASESDSDVAKQQPVIDKQVSSTDVGLEEGLSKKSRYPCPEPSKFRGTSGDDASCVKSNLRANNNVLTNFNDNNTLKNNDDVKGVKNILTCHTVASQSYSKEPKCTCQDGKRCRGACDYSQYKEETIESQQNPTKYNTYPKIVNIDNRKKLLRSNTDDCNIQGQTNIKPDIFTKTQTLQDNQQSGDSDNGPGTSASKDLVMDMINEITNRYAKKDIERSQRKKCFREIMTILNYLLDTEESPDPDKIKALISSTTQDDDTTSKSMEFDGPKNVQKTHTSDCQTKKSDICECPSSDMNIKTQILCESCSKRVYVDKAVQSSLKKSKPKICYTGSSDFPLSTEAPCTTSSDSAACRVLSKIKKECEKYHQRRCMAHNCDGRKCQSSSSTSVNCDVCKRVHHCSCRGYRCRGYKSRCLEKMKKKCVAYNLIIQTSESMMSEETTHENKSCRPLKNIVVKVPQKFQCTNAPFKEVSAKIESRQAYSNSNMQTKHQKSRSSPQMSGRSSTDDNPKQPEMCTVRDYLEKNRPDFVQRCSKRQKCLKLIKETSDQDPCGPSSLQMVVVQPNNANCNEYMETCKMFCGGNKMNCNTCVDSFIQTSHNGVTRIENERAAHRELLSLQLQLQLDKPSALNALSESDLRRVARKLGIDLKRKKIAPKLISEREMKKHSEKIYKSLPEVVQKKENEKKESIKKTNLLLANIFKKNLQKKALSGAVNLSNYSTVVKI